MSERIAQLGRVPDDSTYIVALCSSGMVGEDGSIGIKKQDKAYDIENRYGYNVEEMYTSASCNTRSERFFESYKKKMLHNIPRDTASGPALAAMERAGKLQCVIDNDIHDKAPRGGHRYVINLHGSIYRNQYLRCKKKYPIRYIASAKRTPICRDRNAPIRSMASLIGKMVDNRNMTRTTGGITKANTLLLLGTTLTSEVLCQYIQHFAGRNMVTIHKQKHYLDKDADLMISDHPVSVLPQLGYGEEKTEG